MKKIKHLRLVLIAFILSFTGLYFNIEFLWATLTPLLIVLFVLLNIEFGEVAGDE